MEPDPPRPQKPDVKDGKCENRPVVALRRKLLGEAVEYERPDAEMLACGVCVLLGVHDEDGVLYGEAVLRVVPL